MPLLSLEPYPFVENNELQRVRDVLELNRNKIQDYINVNLTPSSGGVIFTPGLELYHPSSTPYIDFHRAANALGDAGADFNMRIINDAAGQLTISGGKLSVNSSSASNIIADGSGAGYEFGERDSLTNRWVIYANASKARLWDGSDRVTWDRSTGAMTINGCAIARQSPPYGANFAEFSHVSRGAAGGNYSFLSANDGHTYVNASGSATNVWIRYNNTDIGVFHGGSGDFARLDLMTGSDAGTWDQRVLRLHAPSRPGLTGYLTGSGTVFQFMNQGPRWDCLDGSANGYPCGASAFVTISREATKIKGSIKKLEKKHEHTRHKKLRPVRFKRPHSTMHVPCKGKGCKDCSGEGIPGQVNKPFVDKNEDTDFIGFIAEEVAVDFPELINWEPSEEGNWDSEPRPGGIDLGALTAHLTLILQDVVERVEALEGGKK